MAERRTIAEAVAIPPNLEAFIKEGVPGKSVRQAQPSASTDGNDALNASEPATVVSMAKPTEPRSRARSQARGSHPSTRREAENRSAPDRSSDLLDDILVPLTTKLRRRTLQALRRAYLELKLEGRTPSTQQEIIEEAIENWLERRGFVWE